VRKMLSTQLIMELTLEQGGGRETQVQPPLNVWTHYFALRFDELPEYTLVNRRDPNAEPIHRPVVEHDHNWTIEIDAARMPRPAIARLLHTDTYQYDYWIYRPGDPEFDHCDWILNNFENPIRTKGRRWFII